MSLKRLGSLPRKLWFRLAVWYAGIFAVSVFGTFFVFYLVVISVSGERTDQDLLSEAKEFSALLASKGINEVKYAIAIEAESEGKDRMFFRLVTPYGEEICSSDMSSWGNLGIGRAALKRLVDGSEHVFETLFVPEKGHEVRVLIAIIGPETVLQMGQSLEEDKRFKETFKDIFAVAIAALIVLAALIGGMMSKWALFGIEEVTQTAQKISKGSFEQRVVVKAKVDEIEQLTTTFNCMLDRINALVRGMQDVTDNIAHDLKTPITRIRSAAEMVLAKGDFTEEPESLAITTVEECDRLLKMVNAILDISEAETGVMKLDLEILDVTALIEKVVDIYQYVAEEKNIIIRINSPDGFHVKADRTRISQVIANLLDNAIKYTPEGHQIDIKSSSRDGEVAIAVKDTGLGIPGEDLPRIWDRLYRCDQSRSEKGLGLGLSLVRAVILAHNGRVEVSSEPGKGSTFTIYLPATA